MIDFLYGAIAGIIFSVLITAMLLIQIRQDSVIKVKSFSEIKHAANYYGVRKGDLLYFVKKGASSPHHATIIAKVANNTLYYAAHSQPRKEHDAGKSIGTGHLWIVRMK